MTLRKDTLITDGGGLHQLGDGYINWRVGESKIVLDGRFTIADLQWLINYMKSNSTKDEAQ